MADPRQLLKSTWMSPRNKERNTGMWYSECCGAAPTETSELDHAKTARCSSCKDGAVFYPDTAELIRWARDLVAGMYDNLQIVAKDERQGEELEGLIRNLKEWKEGQ